MTWLVGGPNRVTCEDAVERRKLAKLKAEVASGVRSPLPLGYRFVPAGISSRGVMGTQCAKLLEWLADYGAKNRGMLTYLGENGTAVKAQFVAAALDAAHVGGDQSEHHGGAVVPSGRDTADRTGGRRGSVGCAYLVATAHPPHIA